MCRTFKTREIYSKVDVSGEIKLIITVPVVVRTQAVTVVLIQQATEGTPSLQNVQSGFAELLRLRLKFTHNSRNNCHNNCLRMVASTQESPTKFRIVKVYTVELTLNP